MSQPSALPRYAEYFTATPSGPKGSFTEKYGSKGYRIFYNDQDVTNHASACRTSTRTAPHDGMVELVKDLTTDALLESHRVLTGLVEIRKP